MQRIQYHKTNAKTASYVGCKDQQPSEMIKLKDMLPLSSRDLG